MYKVSNYNYFAPDGERVICLNGITNRMFAISKPEYENLQTQLSDLISFQIHYDGIFNLFKDWGFIVDEDADEIDILRFRNKQAIMSDKFYRLIINPTEDCIFNCWYCTQRKDNTGGMSAEVMEKVKKHMDLMFEREKITGLHLDWFGGEPLMYFDEVMYPLAKYGLEKVKEYKLPFFHHVTTNAYLINPEMVEKMKEIHLKSFQITIDGDEERHNTIRNMKGKPTFRRIMDNIILLCEQMPDVNVVLRLNFDEQTLSAGNVFNVFDFIPEKYRKNISVDFQRVWQTKKSGMPENDDLLHLYQQSARLGYRGGLPGGFELGKSNRCYADRYYHTVINYDGKVYKCTLYLQKECGTLHDNGFIEWDSQALTELYAKATFENDRCLACKYLPLCLGPCSQAAKMKKNLPCSYDMSEIRVNNFLIETYKRQQEYMDKILAYRQSMQNTKQ